MKTIFITVRDGAITHHILRTDILSILRDNFKVVLLVPDNKVDYFEEEFRSDNVVIENIPDSENPRFEEIFHQITLYSLHTKTIWVKIRHGYSLNGGVFLTLFKILLWVLGSFVFFKKFIRIIYGFKSDHSFDDLFLRHKPDLVFATDMISPEDFRMIKVARKFGVKSVGMPKSWDNLSSKTFFRILPEHLIVQNKIMKNEAVKYQDYPEDKISVLGFPQYDVYTHKELLESREEFCSSLKLDPNKKTILYAAAGDQLAPFDEEVLNMLIKYLKENSFFDYTQILVRPHPKYSFKSEEIDKDENIVIDYPGMVVGKNKQWEFASDDIIHLFNSLYYSDIIISTFSTLNIEGAIFNKPLISIAFDGKREMSKYLSVARYTLYSHLQNVIKSGGVKVPRKPEELFNAVEEYIKNPELDSLGRKKLITDQLGVMDGKADFRIGMKIVNLIEED